MAKHDNIFRGAYTDAEDLFIALTLNKHGFLIANILHRAQPAIYMRRKKLRDEGKVNIVCSMCSKASKYHYTDEVIFCDIDKQKSPANDPMCRDMKVALIESLSQRFEVARKNGFAPVGP